MLEVDKHCGGNQSRVGDGESWTGERLILNRVVGKPH